MLVGAGPNITVQASGESVAIVNTGTRAASTSVIAAVKQISPHAIRWVIRHKLAGRKYGWKFDFVGGRRTEH